MHTLSDVVGIRPHFGNHVSVQKIGVPVQQAGLAVEDRWTNEREVNLTVARIYNRIAQECDTSLLLTIEDDILPRLEPGETLRRLIGGLSDRVSAVSGVYKSRLSGRHVSWISRFGRALEFVTDTQLTRHRGAYLPVAGSGFGCLLVRRDALRAIPLSVTQTEPWYDPRFFRMLSRLDQSCVVAKHVLCDHLNPPGV